MVHFFVAINGVSATVTRSSSRTVYLDSDEYYVFSIRNLGRLVSGDLTFVRVVDILCARLDDVLAIHVSDNRVNGVSVTMQDRVCARLFYRWLLDHGDDFVVIAETLYENYRE